MSHKENMIIIGFYADTSLSILFFVGLNFTSICGQLSPSQFESHAGMAARRQP